VSTALPVELETPIPRPGDPVPAATDVTPVFAIVAAPPTDVTALMPTPGVRLVMPVFDSVMSPAEDVAESPVPTVTDLTPVFASEIFPPVPVTDRPLPPVMLLVSVTAP
jgi:hypothetical protein